MDLSKIFNDHFSKIKNINAGTVDIKNLEVNDVGVISTDYDISNIRHITASGNLSIGGNISGASFSFKTLANGLYNDALLSNDGYLADINTKYCLKHYEQSGNLDLQGSNSTSTISLKVGASEIINVSNTTITLNQNISVASGKNLTLTSGTVTATNLAGTLTTASQANITSVGTLTGLTCSGVLTISNTTDATAVNTGALKVAGGLCVNKNILIGTETLGTDITPSGSIRFIGTTGDAGTYCSVIGERIYTTNTQNSELFILKGDNGTGDFGPDRIRLTSPNILFQTYNTVAGLHSGTFYLDTIGTNAMLIDDMQKVYIYNNTAGSVSDGALNLPNGGVRIAGNSYIGGTLTIADTTASTTQGTGALKVSGGCSIAKDLMMGTATTAGVTSPSGSIRFAGTHGDVGGYHSCIGERLYGTTEKSELFIFKAGDYDTTYGYDRIRLTGAAILFQTYDYYPTITSSNFYSDTVGGNALLIKPDKSSNFYGDIIMDTGKNILSTINTSGTIGLTNQRWYWIYTENITSTNTINTPSDIRLKKDIEDIDKSFAKNLINDIIPVQYKLKSDVNDRTRMGVIAQDTKNILLKYKPNEDYCLVSGKENDLDYMSVGYTELIAPMITYIQDLQKQINELKNTVNELKNIIKQ